MTNSHRDGAAALRLGQPTGRIESPTSFVNNRDSGIVVASKAKLRMVRCEFSRNKHTIEKRSGGKVTYIA